MRPGWAEELLKAASVSDDGHEIESAPSVAELLSRGNEAAKEGDYERAKSLFEEALDRFPGYSQALFNLAVVLVRMEDKEQAAVRLREYLSQDAFGPAADKARALLADLEEVRG